MDIKEKNFTLNTLVKIVFCVLAVVAIVVIIDNYRYVQVNEKLKYDKLRKEYFIYAYRDDGTFGKKVIDLTDKPSKAQTNKTIGKSIDGAFVQRVHNALRAMGGNESYSELYDRLHDKADRRYVYNSIKKYGSDKDKELIGNSFTEFEQKLFPAY